MRRRLNNQRLAFDWDKGNQTKSLEKHKIATIEAEQVFFHAPLVVKKDVKHSISEERFHALGKTDTGKYLFLAFTVRKRKIRIISARPMDRRERRYYKNVKIQ